MFCTYREVLLPGERPGPGIGLPHQLTKDVDVVVDDALEPRSWYRSESRDLQTLSCMYHFIISRTTNECVVLTILVR
jgi:hypothetical protein